MLLNTPSKITDAIIADLRASLSTLYFEPTDFLILRKIVFLALLHGHNSPKRTIYATPGQLYLAHACELSRATVSRRVSFLSSKGYLVITYRRKYKGEFQTNLYKFGKVLWAQIVNVTRRFQAFFNRVTPKRHIVPLTRVNTTQKVNDIEHDTVFEQLLTRLGKKILSKEVSPPGQ